MPNLWFWLTRDAQLLTANPCPFSPPLITLESRSRTELPGELKRAVREFQLTLRWIVDPNARSWMDDEEWGNLVLLLGLLGKIDFIRRESESFCQQPLFGSLTEFSPAAIEWSDLKNLHGSSIGAQLQAQFDSTVRARYQNLVNTRLTVELADFATFLLERDTTEFFLLGCEKEGMGKGFRSFVDPLDARMRPEIADNILPTLKSNWPLERLVSLTHPLLPLTFWWRHLLEFHPGGPPSQRCNESGEI